MSAPDPIARLTPLVGRWRGLSRVWFEPDVLADESPVEGEVTLRLDGRFVELDYTSAMQGKPLTGRLTMGYYPGRARWEVNLIDSFHMGRGQLFCTGDSTETGFRALGHYPDGQNGPDWGWRVVLTVQSADAFTVTAYNIEPGGPDQKATEMVLERVK